MKALIEVYEVAYYEVKLRNAPWRTFYEEEKALRYIAENKAEYVSMRKTENAIVSFEEE